jgi:hypothetical protein
MQPFSTIWTDLGGTIHILFWIATHFSLTERGGFALKVQISLYGWHIPGSTAQDCACNLQHSRLKHQEQTYLPAKHQSD